MFLVLHSAGAKIKILKCKLLQEKLIIRAARILQGSLKLASRIKDVIQ